jgi:alpha-beta hydrolase superfamily lysophospholipase
MSAILTLILWVVAIGVLIRLHTALWRRYFALDRTGDEVHFATTEDGWKIAVHRYRPPDRKFQEPVFLCHGMGANRFNYDMADDRSLAQELCAQGFEVWVVELRGTGMSSRPRWFSPYGWNYNFDDYLGKDIPAALEVVRAATGSAQTFWAGHSMGGMLGYAWLGLRGDHGIRGLVTISSPVDVGASKAIMRFRPLIWLMALGRAVAWRPMAGFFSPFLGRHTGFLTRLVSVRDGMKGAILRRCLANLVENTTGAVLRQFLSWARSGEFGSRNGEESYLSNLGSIRESVLIMAADADSIAPPDAVTPAYRLIGAEDKQIRVFGRDRGDDYDLGHGDVLVGDHAREVVYPEIVDWLKKRATDLKD